MASPRVLCLGEMLFDRLADQVGPREAIASWTDYPGGAPANVACQLSKLGTPVGYLGCLGRDAAGDHLLAHLTLMGVDTTGVQRHDQAPTRVVEVLREVGGDRQFAGFGGAAADSFADAYLQAEALPEALFATADCLVLGTIPLAYPTSAQAVERTLKLVEEHYLKVVLDVNWRSVFWTEPETAKSKILGLLPRVDFVKLSQAEATWLFETTNAQQILETAELEGVFITLDVGGCDYATGDLIGHVPGFRVAVQDTTGAGDSFVAAFVHQLCRSSLTRLDRPDQVVEILRYANAAGAMTCMGAGAIAPQPTAAELEAFLVGRVG